MKSLVLRRAVTMRDEPHSIDSLGSHMTATDKPSQLKAGEQVGPGFTIDSLIARGGMGAVYKATDTSGTEVAIKYLLDQTQSARFEIETRLLAGLKHPRVVKVIDYFEDSHGSFLVMELVNGRSLADVLFLEGTPGLSTDLALTYTLQACEALQYIHGENIVHRDVKPQNLILTEDGVVLVDFGLARELERGQTVSRVLGTPQFMAPEMLVGEGVSPRSDIYSLAATLWALLVGKPPAYGESTVLTETVKGVTPELERTIRDGLELRPERRIASISAFARALGSPLRVSVGQSLGRSMQGPARQPTLLEAISRAAAGVFEASACSIALIEDVTHELVYQGAWGAGAGEIVGMRLPAGAGIAGSAIERREGIAVADCRSDSRFADTIARSTGYIPHTMLVVPLEREDHVVGALSILDRLDGEPFGPAELVKAKLFADLAVISLTS